LKLKKNFLLVKENISEEKQQNITKLIEKIRQEIQNDNFESLKSKVEELKTAMKDMIAAKVEMNQIQIQCQI
jgi:Txe/YoeB family toxin of Txe-Axe toxin-antitoxin module